MNFQHTENINDFLLQQHQGIEQGQVLSAIHFYLFIYVFLS